MNILYPLFGMVVLTICIVPLVFFARVKQIRTGNLKIEFFELYDGTGAPPDVTKTTRHLSNLFEMPILFYVACLTAFVLGLDSALLIYLGWGYVIVRAIHAFIHLTYNKVVHRITAFMLSNVMVITMWGIIIIQST
ncbi:MAG: MAPEG family protein [Proteobacteria bacterium]|nr:MAPEG family protein [Pseudomonadota bacterium]